MCAEAHEDGRAGDAAEAYDGAYVMDRDSEFGLFFDANGYGLAFFAEVGTLGGDEESVEVLLHGECSES